MLNTTRLNIPTAMSYDINLSKLVMYKKQKYFILKLIELVSWKKVYNLTKKLNFMP